MATVCPDPFAGLATTYARHRPSYPVAAIAYALGDVAATRVVDLGCGTGIATRILAGLVSGSVTAIDRSSDMLSLTRSAEAYRGRIDGVVATAEALPLATQAIDLILCAQAFHWFHRERALGEIARVLRPRGRLALVWNVRDKTTDPFARAYEAVVVRAQASRRAAGFTTPVARQAVDLSPYLEIANVERFANSQVMTEAELIGRARSASYFPRAGPLHAELTEALRAVFAQHSNNGQVELPQFTEVTVARPR